MSRIFSFAMYLAVSALCCWGCNRSTDQAPNAAAPAASVPPAAEAAPAALSAKTSESATPATRPAAPDANVETHAAKPAAPAETLSHVSFSVTTGNDDKECGELVIEISQGDNVVFNEGYGSVLDGDCHDDDSWHTGETHAFEQQVFPDGPALNGQPIDVKAILYERAGEINITWDASIELSVVTSANRKLTWVGTKKFNTNTNRVILDAYDMGSKSF